MSDLHERVVATSPLRSGRHSRARDGEFGGRSMTAFDTVGYLLRARRLQGLSQREMAATMGVAQSTWAGYESGARTIPHHVLEQALVGAGLRLAVVDERGAGVPPFPPDTVRDNAARRFPAHLEVQPPDQLPREALRAPRYDRQQPRAWYHLRDAAQATNAGAGGLDHPTDLEIALRLRAGRTAGAARLKALRDLAAQGVDRAQEGPVDGD